MLVCQYFPFDPTSKRCIINKDENMNDNDRTLELWRNEFIVDIETARLARHARGQAQDREMSEASTETLRSIPPSRESTVTVRAISETPHLLADLADTMDLDEPENGQSTNTRPEAALVVATDFGTTFSAVAFACRDGTQLPNIRMITGYPADPRAGGRAGLEVPTESWYSDASQLAELPFEVDPTPSDDDNTADTDEENIDSVARFDHEHQHRNEACSTNKDVMSVMSWKPSASCPVLISVCSSGVYTLVQMSVVLIALLYETTTAFEDTQIECLSALYVTAWRSKTIAWNRIGAGAVFPVCDQQLVCCAKWPTDRYYRDKSAQETF